MVLTSLKRFFIVTAITLSVASACADSIPVANPSFEIPAIDPIENPFMAIPFAPFWIELDLDTEYSANTGIFRNTPPDSPYGDHIVNAHGYQLAFLSSQSGNAFLQNLPATYEAGRNYRLDVDVCPSMRYPPAAIDPNNALILEFYYTNNEPNLVSLHTAIVPSTELTTNVLKTFSVMLPTVQADAPWAGQPIGIALRANGAAGGYWDLDNVRVTAFPRTPDLTGDAVVNLRDAAVLAAQWDSCIGTTADLTGDGCVTLEELWILAEYWLENLSAE
jgi:hypothetical protein